MQPQKYHKEADGNDRDNHCRLVDKRSLNFLAFIDISDGIPAQYQMISIPSFHGASKRALVEVVKKNTRRNSKPRDRRDAIAIMQYDLNNNDKSKDNELCH